MTYSGDLYMGSVDDPDRYQLWRRIGTGGEGTVWQGTRQLVDGVINVAVKHYHTDRLGAAESLTALSARLETQAARLRQLHTPGLAVVHESFLGPEPHPAGRSDGSRSAAYFVMDYVNGDPLSEWAGTEPRVLRRLAVLEDTAAALDGLHRAGQVHADIKPSNLLVRQVELPDHSRVAIAVLVDFGVMRAVTQQPPTTVIGTEGFIAPELRHGGTYSPASDLYAFAMVCAGLVCGGPVDPDIAAAARAANLPAESIAVLLAGLHHDPDHRTRELDNGIAGWLSRLRGGLTTYATLPAPPTLDLTEPAPPPPTDSAPPPDGTPPGRGDSPEGGDPPDPAPYPPLAPATDTADAASLARTSRLIRATLAVAALAVAAGTGAIFAIQSRPSDVPIPDRAAIATNAPTSTRSPSTPTTSLMTTTSQPAAPYQAESTLQPMAPPFASQLEWAPSPVNVSAGDELLLINNSAKTCVLQGAMGNLPTTWRASPPVVPARGQLTLTIPDDKEPGLLVKCRDIGGSELRLFDRRF
jgi:serine/threonine protein kinase